MNKAMLETLIMRGDKCSYTIMSGYYKYYMASLTNNASAKNFVLEIYEQDTSVGKSRGVGSEKSKQG